MSYTCNQTKKLNRVKRKMKIKKGEKNEKKNFSTIIGGKHGD